MQQTEMAGATVLPEANNVTALPPDAAELSRVETETSLTGSVVPAAVLTNKLATQEDSIDAETKLVAENVAITSVSASLAERTLSGIAQQYSTPVADYAGWAKQQKQPRLTVATEQQQLSANNAVVGVGMQMARVGDRCLIVDPSLSGFEQLMGAKGIPCKESDDAVLFRQVMSKWLER